MHKFHMMSVRFQNNVFQFVNVENTQNVSEINHTKLIKLNQKK